MAARVVLLAELTDDSKEQYNCRNETNTRQWSCFGGALEAVRLAENTKPSMRSRRSLCMTEDVPKKEKIYDGVSHFASEYAVMRVHVT